MPQPHEFYSEDIFNKVLPDMLWQALLQQCASNPEKAIRLVMVNKEDVTKAVAAVKEKLKEIKGD